MKIKLQYKCIKLTRAKKLWWWWWCWWLWRCSWDDGDDDDDDDLANEKRNLSVSVAVQLAPADCYLFDLRPHFHLHRYFFSPNFQMIFRLCVFFICLFSFFFFFLLCTLEWQFEMATKKGKWSSQFGQCQHWNKRALTDYLRIIGLLRICDTIY